MKETFGLNQQTQTFGSKYRSIMLEYSLTKNDVWLSKCFNSCCIVENFSDCQVKEFEIGDIFNDAFLKINIYKTSDFKSFENNWKIVNSDIISPFQEFPNPFFRGKKKCEMDL